MDDTYSIQMLLKFGSEKDITDMYLNGTIFMSPIQRFREIEDDELRGDLYEGVSRITNYLPGKFEIPEISFKGTHHGIHLRESYEKVLGNIYSLYCISSHGWKNPNDFFIDKRMKRFGSHCLLIKDNKRFFELMIERLKQLGVNFRHGFIEYYDKKTINRPITLFEKPSEFEYQNEFRFYVEKNSLKSFKFSIGSLENISEISTTDLVVDTLEMKVINNTNESIN